MKTPRFLSFVVPILLTTLVASAEPVIPADDMPAMHPHSLIAAIGNVLIFAFIGIAAAIIGYKLFDKCTPGDLHREIIEHRNIAAAIVAAAVIIGVSIIIAASMIG
jgi:uncharacterized membrane protein YjfL (UPF0719 family)